MRKVLSFLMILSFLFSPFHTHYAKNDQTINQIEEIASFEYDVTGDGVMEKMILRGSYLSENSSFYHDIWLDVTSEYTDKWKISFASGYEPKLQFIHLTNDEIADLFYSVRKTEKKTPMVHQLYSLRNGKVTQLPLPKVNRMSGLLRDHFLASVAIDSSEKTLTIDLSKVKHTLIDRSLYDSSGKLQQQTKIFVQPISVLQPILLSKNKGYGLKSIQYVTIEQTDVIVGAVESIWYFEQDNWVRLKTNYKQR